MVGGMVGGSSGVQTGAKVGAVVGATGAAVGSEPGSPRCGFGNPVAHSIRIHRGIPECSAFRLQCRAAGSDDLLRHRIKSATPGGEAIIRKDGKPIVGITFPSDWKQKAGDNSVSATSAKGNAWSGIATLDGVKDKEAGIAKS